MARLVINRDNYIVDLETGEVVDDQPICIEASCEIPPGLPRDEWERRLRTAVFHTRRSRGRLQTVTFKLPQWLLELIDREVAERGFSSRSVLIRDALASYLSGQNSILDSVKRLRSLYAARGFLYAVRPLLAFARAYLDDEILRDDVKRVEEELEAAIKHVEDELARLHRKLGLW